MTPSSQKRSVIRSVPLGSKKVYRSQSGRLISEQERIAAAQTRVVTDKRLGIKTDQWIVNLAEQVPPGQVG